MTTKIEIDENLLVKAQELSNTKDQGEVVKKALEMLISRMEAQKQLAELRGKVEFFEGYDG